MINVTLVRRTARDYWLLAAGAILALFAFVILFMFATNSIPLEEGRRWMQLEWVRRLINAMAGGDLGNALTPTGVSSFVFTHPLMWVLIVSFIFTIASGTISGEMDRGTIDLLATLPISRPRIYASVSAVTLLYGVPMIACAWAGVAVGSRLVGVSDATNLWRLGIVAVNCYAAYALIAGVALCTSAWCERRGVALVWSFVLVFYSFILNLLSAFWPAAQHASFTGLFHYYKPIQIVLDGRWPTGSIGVLVGASLVFWIAGLICFCRRDIHTN